MKNCFKTGASLQRFQTSITEEIYSFVLFHAGGSRPGPQVPTPLDPRMNKRPRTMKQCSLSCYRGAFLSGTALSAIGRIDL